MLREVFILCSMWTNSLIMSGLGTSHLCLNKMQELRLWILEGNTPVTRHSNLSSMEQLPSNSDELSKACPSE